MPIFEIKETVAEPQDLEKTANPLLVQRIRWLLKIKAVPNISLSELATAIGINEFQMDRWAALYRFGGIETLLDIRTIDSPTAPNNTFSGYAKEMLQQLFRLKAFS